MSGGKRGLPVPQMQVPLLEWLMTALAPMPRSRVKEHLRQGRVCLNGKATTQFDQSVGPADRLELMAKGIPAPDRSLGALKTIFADASLLVVDKPAGLLSVGAEGETTRTAVAGLNRNLAQLGMGRAVVVHRLDRETSGLMLFARSREIRDQLQARWDQVEKTYLAWVEGAPPLPHDRIESHLSEGTDLKVRETPPGPDARLAITEYRTVTTSPGRTLLEVRLITGRKHQIRAHLGARGLPIVGDRLYGAKTDPLGRLGLHAWKLALKHPVTGQPMSWESPPPRGFAKGMAKPGS